MNKTKWADYKFDADQKKARAKWRNAEKQRSDIVAALMSCNHFISREDMHKRLDRRLDTIERMQASARELFPEVKESFTVAKMTVKL